LTKVERHLNARTGGVAAAAAALVFAVGVGSGRSLAHVGGQRTLVAPGSYGGDLLLLAAVAVVAGLGVIVYASGLKRRNPDDEDDRLPGRLPVPWWAEAAALAVGLAVIAATVAALSVFAHHPRAAQPLPAGSAHAGGGIQARPRTSPPSVPPVHWWGVAATAAALLAAALVAARRLRRGGDLPAAGSDEAADVHAAITLSLAEIESEPDPRRAVIRAYARMEDILGRHAVSRRPFETSLEYLRRALGSLHVSGHAAQRLAALFERAKFSPHEIGAGMKWDAIAALTAVRDELEEAP
jgi:uncharacterized protein DUF4129